jgi:hypothetical protein
MPGRATARHQRNAHAAPGFTCLLLHCAVCCDDASEDEPVALRHARPLSATRWMLGGKTLPRQLLRQWLNKLKNNWNASARGAGLHKHCMQ